MNSLIAIQIISNCNDTIHCSPSNQEGSLLKYQNCHEEPQHNNSLYIISKSNGTASETIQESSWFNKLHLSSSISFTIWILITNQVLNLSWNQIIQFIPGMCFQIEISLEGHTGRASAAAQMELWWDQAAIPVPCSQHPCGRCTLVEECLS